MCVNQRRVANAPNAGLARSNELIPNLHRFEKEPSLIDNIHVAAGGKKLYDAPAQKGRVATQGIHFDTGSDRLGPESSATRKEIGTMLKEHPDLKLTIEGHPDNQGRRVEPDLEREARGGGGPVPCRQLSGGRRAAHGHGLGQSKPAAPNDTPEGRQNNRRVELVKM